MARKLRIQYAGALYHVINRGNYRRDLFESVGEAKAFLGTVKEAKERMGWRVHAYVLMRNHYHLALETPEPTLVEGMHWLQSTWATRFNRFRKESGHLFQGRYKAILVQDIRTMGKVVDYIHLNPVRAKIVEAGQVRSYRWSSLADIVKGEGWVDDEGWRATGGFGEDRDARQSYESRLIEIGQEEERWKELGLIELSKGWALGTAGWRKAMAEEYGRLALRPGLELEETKELREGAWEKAVQAALSRMKKKEEELETKPRRQDWKLAVAQWVRQETGASASWLAPRLHLGHPASLRSYLSRYHASKNQQTTARPPSAPRCFNPSATLNMPFPSMRDDGTPNVYAQYQEPGMSAPSPYLALGFLQGSAGSFVNFYNQRDYALSPTGGAFSSGSWQTDNQLKPNQGYGYNGVDGFFKSTPGGGLAALRLPRDRFEIFSFGAEARSFAVGAAAGVGDAFGSEVNLDSSTYNFGPEHIGHSAQFRSYAANRRTFWMQLLVSFQLRTPE